MLIQLIQWQTNVKQRNDNSPSLNKVFNCGGVLYQKTVPNTFILKGLDNLCSAVAWTFISGGRKEIIFLAYLCWIQKNILPSPSGELYSSHRIAFWKSLPPSAGTLIIDNCSSCIARVGPSEPMFVNIKMTGGMAGGTQRLITSREWSNHFQTV